MAKGNKTQLTRNQISEKVRDILADLLVLHPEEIQPDSLLVDELDADSIVFLELYYMIEKAFGVKLPDTKVNEEILSQPMTDGLGRLESIPGGVTLFEYVHKEAGSATRFHDQTVGDFAAVKGTVVPDDLDPKQLMSGIQINDLPKLGVPLPEDGKWERFRELTIQEGLSLIETGHQRNNRDRHEFVVDHEGDDYVVDRQLLTELLRLQTAGSLSGAVGGRVPDGLSSHTMLSSLMLRDLFRFLTVESLVGFVQFILENPPPTKLR